jgi:hypothetical protein
MSVIKCALCGESLSPAMLQGLIESDQDPEFTYEEKRFMIANWWLAGEDEGAHECKVIAAL